MRKLIILSMILILGLSLMAYTAAMKIDFINGPYLEDNGIAEGCFAIVNYTPDDDVKATIQIQVRDLDPKTEYEVRSNFVPLGTFTTNKKGSGSFHYNVTDPAFEKAEERYIGIWIGDTNYLWLEIVVEKLTVVQLSGQNAINRTEDHPHINWEIDGLCIEFEFVNPTKWSWPFDHRVDGEEGETHPWSEVVPDEGELIGQELGLKYNWVTVAPFETETVIVCAKEEVWVGLRGGPENNWFLEWIIFEVK